jgi:hypothetical protein
VATTAWQLTGDYFENCNCDVVCPCLVSDAAPLTATPTQGVCNVALLIHIDHGRYGEVTLDGLNAAVIAHTPGRMADGNWTIAAYLDEHADDAQAQALGTILGGTAGGPMAAFAPMIGRNLGAKKVRIEYHVEGKRRRAVIPGILHMGVRPLPTMSPEGEMWVNAGHPFSPDHLALAVGEDGNSYADHGMRFDNGGRNGHYAPIAWSGA